ncbi:hypothetical protein [Paracoccus sp. KR1-242]|uniref:hypothetical protein n=1 Tax=Paracoccus sp. KR1-242 TaxID=3410028 RepID=UPI003BFF8239
MIDHNPKWLTLYQKASLAAEAAKKAETSPGAAGRCMAAAQVNGGPACVCPICKARRASGREIGQFDAFWRDQATPHDLADILERAQKDLIVTLENGTETRVETLSPPASKTPDGQDFRLAWDNADEFQRYLAQWLPEIAARIDGDPPEASTDLADTVRRARDFLMPLTEAPEVTKGAAGMSRRAYSVAALRLLDEVENLSAAFASAPADDDGDEPPEHEQRWWRECFAEIAVRAFNAGMLARAAGGKEIEADALKKRGEVAKNQKNAPKGGDKNRLKKEERYAVLNRLARESFNLFSNVGDRQALRNAKSLAREYDRTADPKLFASEAGKPLRDIWFKDWLATFRLPGNSIY